ncbi:hypothetical protein R1sor_007485 [Riccia sorocarpa]|uniref:SUN domain-containing protein n=1 Tax=Riccia sorocarpa TaxID=122646 RepID=A0ABD3HT77_9MARC
MKKSALPIRKKSVRGRVSAVHQGRCIHGLPWSLPLASWTLILFLLLTSSFSHVHDTEQQVGRNDAADALEDHPYPLASEEVVSDKGLEKCADISSLQSTEDFTTDSSTNPTSSIAGTEDISDQESHAQPVPSASRNQLDALQYAEYGAELLHKSGAADELSDNCMPDSTAGQTCPHFVDLDGFGFDDSGRSWGNLYSKNGASSQRESLASDGSSDLAQRRSSVSTENCKIHRSLWDSFLHSVRQQKEQQRCSSFGDGEGTREPNLQASTTPLGQAELETKVPELPTDEDLPFMELSDSSCEEGENETSNLGLNAESPDTSTKEEVERTADLSIRADVGTDGQQDLISSETTSYVDAFDDSKNVEDSSLLVYPLDLEDVFADELQSMISTDDEALSSAVKPHTSSGAVATEGQLEPVKLRRVGSVMSLDEYKKSILEKQNLGRVVDLSTLQAPKTRQSDETYNYAATTHGAKVLGANKEAKGAGHIINSDKDKYLRNPCSAEDKFVVLELSEETFVDTVVIANFEFHSANMKDFEVYGSPVYPTKEWILLGQFRAENVRHRQKFTIDDPKLVRYVMLKMLTHWGSEFFCTLSSVEVFGVDVIKNLLDDWIASEESESAARAQTTTPVYHPEEAPAETQGSSVVSADGAVAEDPSLQPSAEVNIISQDAVATVNGEKKVDTKEEDLKAGSSGQPELHHIPGGKPPGDSVLKILMQRVKALELNQSLFDNYLEDTNVKYKAMLSELDKDLAVMSERLRNATAMSALLAMRLLEMESKQKEEKVYLENQLALISSNFTENVEFMRWQIQSMERRELTAIILAFCSPVLASLLLLLARCLPNRRSFPSEKQTEPDADTKNLQLDSCRLPLVCRLSSSVILYLSCGLIILVLSV